MFHSCRENNQFFENRLERPASPLQPEPFSGVTRLVRNRLVRQEWRREDRRDDLQNTLLQRRKSEGRGLSLRLYRGMREGWEIGDVSLRGEKPAEGQLRELGGSPVDFWQPKNISETSGLLRKLRGWWQWISHKMKSETGWLFNNECLTISLHVWGP